jgi:uncharacterized membrane protein YphA (DoxX/SURF4 family)
MNSTQRYALAISRVLVAMIFLLNGLGIVSQAQAAKELIEHGAPASLVPILMLGARALEVLAGLGLALGIYPRLAAAVLLVFLIPATLLAHAFWHGLPYRATYQLLKEHGHGRGLAVYRSDAIPTNTASECFVVKRSRTREKRDGLAQVRASLLIQGDEGRRDGHHRAGQDLR